MCVASVRIHDAGARSAGEPVTPASRSNRPAAVAALLILGAVLLVIGVNIEQAGEAGEAGHHPAATGSAAPGEAGAKDGDTGSAGDNDASEPSTSPEQAGSSEPTGSSESTEATGEGEGEHAEGLPARLGLEKPLALTAMLVISLGLAGAVWWRPIRPVTAVVAVFALAAGVFDVIEIGHDISVDHGGLAVLAGIIAASRVAVIAGAADLWRHSAARVPETGG